MASEHLGDSLEQVLVSASRPSDPQLSPDGRFLAWCAEPYGKEGEHPEGVIWSALADGSEQGRQLTFGHGQDRMPRWSPDGQTLAFLSDRDERGTSALYAISISGGEAEQIYARKTSISSFEWSPEGRCIAFIASDEPTAEFEKRKEERDDANVYGERWEYSRLYVLTVSNGNVQALPTGDRHVSHLAWSPDGERIAWVSRPTPELETLRHSELFVAKIGEEKPTRIFSIPSWTVDRLHWTLDGRHLVFLAAHESTLSAITTFAVDPQGGVLRVIGPDASEESCADSLVTAAGDSRPVLAVARGLITSLEWLEPDSGRREALYQPEVGDISHEFSVVAPEGTEPTLAVIRSSGDRPPEVHAGTPSLLRRVSNHHESFADYSFGTQEAFFWNAPDGLELDGLLIRPADSGEGPPPTIVLVHGGPYGRYTAGWNSGPGHWAQMLSANGYAVLLPNYRGGMGHGNEFAKWAHGGVGDMEFQDVMSAVDAAVERGFSDPDRLGIGGWSQGGFMTAWAVTQTDRFKAGVMGAGVSDWNMMVMTSDVPTLESMLGGNRPWDGPGPHRSQKHSPISYAGNVETPVLILHGEQDARVPVSQAIGFHRALMENGVESQLVTYPREPHGFRERNHQLDVLRRVRDWFQRWV